MFCWPFLKMAFSRQYNKCCQLTFLFGFCFSNLKCITGFYGLHLFFELDFRFLLILFFQKMCTFSKNTCKTSLYSNTGQQSAKQVQRSTISPKFKVQICFIYFFIIFLILGLKLCFSLLNQNGEFQFKGHQGCWPIFYPQAYLLGA